MISKRLQMLKYIQDLVLGVSCLHYLFLFLRHYNMKIMNYRKIVGILPSNVLNRLRNKKSNLAK